MSVTQETFLPKTELLEQIAAAYADFEELLASLEEAHMIQPPEPGEMSVKDLFIPGFVVSSHASFGKNIDVAGWFKWTDAIKAKGDADITAVLNRNGAPSKICTQEQVEEEFKATLDLVKFVLASVGLDEYRVQLSLRDPASDKYVGSEETWEKAQGAFVDQLGVKQWNSMLANLDSAVRAARGG